MLKISCFSQGKGLFATRSFKTGDVILEENPMVSCQFAWNATYKYLACDFCMRYVSLNFLLLILLSLPPSYKYG